jgi:hypothetical protein
MHKLIIKPFAEMDAMDSANWYNQRRDGLGNEFLLALDAKFNAIRRNPLQFNLIYKNIRRALTERFPYAVFFIIENGVVYVLATIHTSRSTKIWKERK